MRCARDILLVAVLVSGCARPGAPPGGPPDSTPPTVAATYPDSGAVRVDREARLEIEFSEPMNRNSVLDWVRLSPPIDFAKRGWDGRRFQMWDGEDFRENTTYTVIVGTGSRDLRAGNPMAAPYQFTFSTGDRIDQGRIEGIVVPKGQQAHGTYVWAFDTEFARARTDTVLPDYLAQSAADSTFGFLGLRTGKSYVVAAHFDANRDREFDRELEFLATFPDTITLTDDEPAVRGIAIDFRDPRAPGNIAGVVLDSDALQNAARRERQAVEAALAAAARFDSLGAAAADTAAIVAAALDTVVMFTVQGWPFTEPGSDTRFDSSGVTSTTTDTLGLYELANLPPGYWRVEAYVDQNGNQRYDAGEPAAEPADSVLVLPVENTEDIDFVVPGASGMQPSEE